MSLANKKYVCILKEIINAGDLVTTRNHEVFSHFDLPNVTFTTTPLVTLRKTAWKKALREMEWFLSGDSKCPDELLDWWSGQLDKDNWLIDGYGMQFRRSSYRTHNIFRENDNSFDQVKFIQEALKHNPNSRRLLMTTWNAGEMACITETNNNPNTPTCCFPRWANVLTKSGIKQLGDLEIGEKIWDGVKYVTVTAKWSKGIQDVYAYSTRKGTLYCTEDHKVFNGKKLVKAKEAKRLHLSLGEKQEVLTFDPNIVMDGLVVADGVSNNFKTKTSGIKLHIGSNDYDYFASEISHLIIRQNAPTHNPTEYLVSSTITSLPITYERTVPEVYIYGSYRDKVSFLRGYFSGNGYNSTLLGCKATSKKLIEQLQIMLNSLGINTSVYITKPREIKWENGIYTSKESYDLTILKQDIPIFMEKIGFLQKYKMVKVHEVAIRNTSTAKVKSSEYHSTEEVFDITVDSEEHLFWCNGFTVSNCHSIVVQFFVRNGRLNMKTYQRSADMLLGVPHNWIQSWAMLMWFAHHAGLKVGSMTWMWGDAHIYNESSHVNTAETMISLCTGMDEVKMVYTPTSTNFKASDFTIVGEIPEPIVTTRPKLL